MQPRGIGSLFSGIGGLELGLEAFPTVRIYVHSSWRYMWREDRPEDIADFLGPLAARYVRNIPEGIKGKRHDVIKYDMYRDGFTGPWLAIDDESGSFEEAGATQHLVATDPKKALACPMKRSMLIAKLKLASSGVQRSRVENGA